MENMIMENIIMIYELILKETILSLLNMRGFEES
jgi:hypothetical protein